MRKSKKAFNDGKERKELKNLKLNRNGEKVKKDLSGIHKLFALHIKLIAAFFVPITFIIILGFVSYRKAEDGMRDSYEKSTIKTMNMTGKYLQLGIKSIDSLSIQYSNDKNMQKYLIGLYKDDSIKSNNVLQDFKNSAYAKEITDDFISSISVFSQKVTSISTLSKLQADIYSGFLETELGKNLGVNSSLWVGKNEFLDVAMGIDSSKYAMRLIRDFTNGKALIVIDMDKNTISDVLSSMDFEKEGLISLITPDGKEIFAKDQESNKESVFTKEEFYKKATVSEKESDSDYVKYKGKEHLFLYSKIGETGAILCAVIPKDVILRQADGIKKLTVLIVIIACIIAFIIAFFISKGIYTTIKDINSKLKKAAEGDFNVQFITKRKDEFRILINEINSTFSNVKSLISQVINLSGGVSTASGGVTATSQLFLESTKDITIAMNEIEQGVIQQAKDAEECLQQMDVLSNKIVQMNSNTNEINKIAADAKKRTQEGTIVTRELTEQTKSTIKITTDIVQGIENLALKSNLISSIINTINDISSQTNLLSFNASIEAARAGEYGKGFAVVANEIRNLADQSSQSVNDIQKIIGGIQGDTKNLVNIAKQAETVLVQQDTAVKNTTDSYLDINESVDNLMHHLKSVMNDVNNLEEARVSTLSAIENISAVMEEIAASSNHVNQISINQLQSVESLNQSAGDLNDQSDKLVSAVQRFTV